MKKLLIVTVLLAGTTTTLDARGDFPTQADGQPGHLMGGPGTYPVMHRPVHHINHGHGPIIAGPTLKSIPPETIPVGHAPRFRHKVPVQLYSGCVIPATGKVQKVWAERALVSESMHGTEELKKHADKHLDALCKAHKLMPKKQYERAQALQRHRRHKRIHGRHRGPKYGAGRNQRRIHPGRRYGRTPVALSDMINKKK